MSESVTAAEANRAFSKVLRRVRDGETVVITAHGRAVAKMIPADEEEAGRIQARKNLLARLRRGSVTRIGKWSRDELYDE
jgi:prevent-host-death family protein